MKVTGFSFIRNAIIYDYPIREAIESILPLCNDFVVAVGKSDDTTLDLIKSIASEKIKIIETVWDDNLRDGGRVLAEETNKAFREISNDTDWAFYIQGDEVVHEKYHDIIYQEMERWKSNQEIDGLLFKYKHFYGSYDYIGISPDWYRKEIRIIRNDKNIYSFRDAQGFRKGNNEKLNVKPIDAFIYHYGWVKPPAQMQKKQEAFNRYWHNDEWIERNVEKADEFDYSDIEALSFFTETHPLVIQKRIKESNWVFDHDISKRNLSLKSKFKLWVERLTGHIPFEYKNYKIKK